MPRECLMMIKMSELLAKKQRKKFVVIGSAPFRFEGIYKLQQVDDVIEVLRKITDNIIVLPYENLRSSLCDLPFTTMFTMADYYAIEAIGSILNLEGWSMNEQVSKILQNDEKISAAITKVKKYLYEDESNEQVEQ
jgi:cell division GTPase FtsZ